MQEMPSLTMAKILRQTVSLLRRGLLFCALAQLQPQNAAVVKRQTRMFSNPKFK
jgi:hypothetical protein